MKVINVFDCVADDDAGGASGTCFRSSWVIRERVKMPSSVDEKDGCDGNKLVLLTYFSTILRYCSISWHARNTSMLLLF